MPVFPPFFLSYSVFVCIVCLFCAGFPATRREARVRYVPSATVERTGRYVGALQRRSKGCIVAPHDQRAAGEVSLPAKLLFFFFIQSLICHGGVVWQARYMSPPNQSVTRLRYMWRKYVLYLLTAASFPFRSVRPGPASVCCTLFVPYRAGISPCESSPETS